MVPPGDRPLTSASFASVPGYHPSRASSGPSAPRFQARETGPNITGNYTGVVFRVAVANVTHPFLSYSIENIGSQEYYTGLFPEVWRRVAELVGVKYEFTALDSSYDEIVAQIAAGDYDIAIGDMTLTEGRAKVVDYTLPWTDSGLVVTTRKAKEVSDSWQYFSPLSLSVWLLLLLFFIFGAHVLWVLERKEGKEHGQGWVRSSYVWGMADTLNFAFMSAFLPGFGDINIRTVGGRLFTFFWLGGLFIILSAYQANLASFLTVPRLQSKITGYDSLRSGNYKIGAYEENSEDSSYTLLRDKGFRTENLVGYWYTQESFVILQNGTVDALVEDFVYQSYMVHLFCDVELRGAIFNPYYYGFLVNRGLRAKFPDLVPDLNKALIFGKSDDSIATIKNVWYGNNEGLISKDGQRRKCIDTTTLLNGNETRDELATVPGPNKEVPITDAITVTEDAVRSKVLTVVSFAPLFIIMFGMGIFSLCMHYAQRKIFGRFSSIKYIESTPAQPDSLANTVSSGAVGAAKRRVAREREDGEVTDTQSETTPRDGENRKPASERRNDNNRRFHSSESESEPEDNWMLGGKMPNFFNTGNNNNNTSNKKAPARPKAPEASSSGSLDNDEAYYGEGTVVESEEGYGGYGYEEDGYGEESPVEYGGTEADLEEEGEDEE